MKVLIIANDSSNNFLYKDIHAWYVTALSKLGATQIDFAHTSETAPTVNASGDVYPFSYRFDFNKSIGVNAQQTKWTVEQLSGYDFVFISLFSVDRLRECYTNASFSSLRAALKSTSTDGYTRKKIDQNAKLIRAATLCKDNGIKYCCYTFDPMLDPYLANHPTYTFLPLSGYKWFDLLSLASEDERQASWDERKIELVAAYNENLQFLADERYDDSARRKITASLVKLSEIVDKQSIAFSSNRWYNDKCGVLRQIRFSSEPEGIRQDALSRYRMSAKHTLLMPNYDCMTWSYRRVFEDLANGSIPLIALGNETKEILDQLPKEFLDIANKYNLFYRYDDASTNFYDDLTKAEWDACLAECKTFVKNSIKNVEKQFQNILK